MAYWVSVCQSDTNPGVRSGGPGAGSVACVNPDGTSSAVALEAQLMVVPPAGSGYDGFWQLGSLTISDAETILGSVLLLWAIAWGFRQLAKAIFSPGSGDDE